MPELRRSVQLFVAALRPQGRDVLLRVLTSGEQRRAAVIGQAHAAGSQDLEELLILLEENEAARWEVVEALAGSRFSP